MLDFSIYLLYRAGAAVVSILPLRWLFSIGEAAGLLAWLLLRHYRRLAQRNLTIAFGKEKSATDLRRLARRHFQRLGANLLCSVKLGAMPLEEVAKVVAFENEDLMHNKLRAGQSVVLALSHLSCWELFAPVAQTHFGYARASTVYQSLGNRWVDAEVRRQRARAGVELFDRREGFQNPINFLRNGGLVAILMDQHAGDHGLWTPFFRSTRFDDVAPRAPRETHGCSRHARRDRHRGPRALADGFRAADRFRRRFGRWGYSKAERRPRATDSARTRGLVLGSQSLENTKAEFSSDQLQARHSPARQLYGGELAAFSNIDSRLELARRQRHQHVRRARAQGWSA